MANNSGGGIPTPLKIGIPVVVVVGLAVVLLSRGGEQQVEQTEVRQIEVAETEPTEPDEFVVTIDRAEIEVMIKELTYLPNDVTIAAEAARSAALASGPERRGSQRLRGVRPLTDREKHGDFMSPRISPDGLQVLVTRPGYQGIYLLPADGGEPIHIADGNAYRAKWTEDGMIEVRGEDGMIRTYGPDGTLESTRPHDPTSEMAFADNDVIFTRPQPGAAPMPLTGNDDRYFNPVLSPDGQRMVYEGLYSGLYMANADGTGEPVFLGSGNNPTWLADGSGLVYDVTVDDGHILVGGDIYFSDRDGTERTNLTEGDQYLGQMPTIGPDGTTVAFESDGVIYAGEIE